MMKRKLLALALSTMLMPVAGTALAQAGKISGDVVKIAVLTDMSGVYSDLGGKGSVVAAEMAIEDFKAQFKPKFKIDLVSADHQNKADVGSNKVREWYDTQGVDMVTDVLNSGVAIAVANAEAMTRVQRSVPGDVQGRVFGVLGSLSEGLRPAGLALGAPVLTVAGVSGAFVVIGAGVVLATAGLAREIAPTPEPAIRVAAVHPGVRDTLG